MKSIPKNIQLSKDPFHQFPWSTECLTLLPEFNSGSVRGQQLQQHRQMANALVDVQLSSVADPMNCSKPGLPVHHQLPSSPKLMSVESVMPSKHVILFCPLLLPSIFPSIRVFSNKLALCIRWPKYWSLGFSISPSNECSGLISFRSDWFDFLAVQVCFKSLLQHHSSKTSILWCSAFFMVKGEFNTIKCLFYKGFSASQEEVMSP